jgi:hypothetical protein
LTPLPLLLPPLEVLPLPVPPPPLLLAKDSAALPLLFLSEAEVAEYAKLPLPPLEAAFNLNIAAFDLPVPVPVPIFG